MNIIAGLLGKILAFSYSVSGDYLAALVIFTLITKIILLPVSIAVQINGIKLVKLTPELNMIKCDFYGDKERISEETLALYKREKYNPFVSLIPLVIQLVLLMGVIETVKDPVYSGITADRMISLGIDLSLVPAESAAGYILFPIIAAASSLIMSAAQNRSQVLQAEQSKLNKYGMAAFSAVLSLYLGFFVTAGIAVYWIFSNIFSTLQIYLLNLMIDPAKNIDYEALEKSKKRLSEFSEPDKSMSRELRKRQNKDFKRFFSVDNKHIVFYSESSGYYKYFRRLIKWLTSHSNVKIHYVTGDPDDVIFDIAKENKQIIPYFIGEMKLIPLFMKLDSKLVVMTMPDLDTYHIKRSYVSKDTEYIYMDHGISSMNMLTRKGSLDNFDTVFCAGPHISEEMRAQEKTYGIKERRLVEYGYGLMEDLTEKYNEWKSRGGSSAEPFILLAPSHQKDNILDSCLETVVNGLKKAAPVVIRPHPQYIRRYPDKWNSIMNMYADDPDVTLQSDFSSDDTIYKSAFVVTDWSNIGYEFAFSTLRPVMFVNTPMKVINPDYKDIGVVPIDISIRSRIGIEVSGSDSGEISAAAEKLISRGSSDADEIAAVRDSVIYNFMHSDEKGGRYILSRLK